MSNYLKKKIEVNEAIRASLLIQMEVMILGKIFLVLLD